MKKLILIYFVFMITNMFSYSYSGKNKIYIDNHAFFGNNLCGYNRGFHQMTYGKRFCYYLIYNKHTHRNDTIKLRTAEKLKFIR